MLDIPSSMMIPFCEKPATGSDVRWSGSQVLCTINSGYGILWGPSLSIYMFLFHQIYPSRFSLLYSHDLSIIFSQKMLENVVMDDEPY